MQLNKYNANALYISDYIMEASADPISQVYKKGECWRLL